MRDAMVDLPWQSVHPADHQRQYLALLSYLPLKGSARCGSSRATCARSAGNSRRRRDSSGTRSEPNCFAIDSGPFPSGKSVAPARSLAEARRKGGGAGDPGSFAYGKMPRHLYASTTRLIATMYAAWRMSTFFDSRMSQTRPNALSMIPSSFWSTSDFVQKNSERFWTHSKYDTVTPPPFARMSGIRRIPRLWKRSSAYGVVGPFAPSAMIFAFTRGAFWDVSTPSSAHGARIFTSSSRSASFVTSFVPGKPTTLPVRSLNARTSFGSNPFSL